MYLVGCGDYSQWNPNIILKLEDCSWQVVKISEANVWG
jgi:hypothetical protein